MRKVLVPLAMLAFLFGGCQAQGGVTVRMDEYALEPDPGSGEAGTITFTARNDGGIAHQLLILETERDADDLPTTEQGVVPVGTRGIEQLAEIPIVATGDSEALSQALEPGSYVLICNIAGHYDNGMSATFRVS